MAASSSASSELVGFESGSTHHDSVVIGFDVVVAAGFLHMLRLYAAGFSTAGTSKVSKSLSCNVELQAEGFYGIYVCRSKASGMPQHMRPLAC